jgi:hypothetical protein
MDYSYTGRYFFFDKIFNQSKLEGRGKTLQEKFNVIIKASIEAIFNGRTKINFKY